MPQLTLLVTRWLRLRLNMVPLTAAVLEPLGESVPLGVYAAWSIHHLVGVNPFLWFALHWTIWCTLDYIQLRGIRVPIRALLGWSS